MGRAHEQVKAFGGPAAELLTTIATTMATTMGTMPANLRRQDGAEATNTSKPPRRRNAGPKLPPCEGDRPQEFEAGMQVEAHSLSCKALNGLRGHVSGTQGERVRVVFPPPHDEKALRPANLRVIE